jgi:hypothetical protein
MQEMYFGIRNSVLWRTHWYKMMESPTTRKAGGLDFSAIRGKIQKHGSALIGAGGTGCKAPGLKAPNFLYRLAPVKMQ